MNSMGYAAICIRMDAFRIGFDTGDFANDASRATNDAGDSPGPSQIFERGLSDIQSTLDVLWCVGEGHEGGFEL